MKNERRMGTHKLILLWNVVLRLMPLFCVLLFLLFFIRLCSKGHSIGHHIFAYPKHDLQYTLFKHLWFSSLLRLISLLSSSYDQVKLFFTLIFLFVTILLFSCVLLRAFFWHHVVIDIVFAWNLIDSILNHCDDFISHFVLFQCFSLFFFFFNPPRFLSVHFSTFHLN